MAELYWDGTDIVRAAGLNNTVAIAFVAARFGQPKTEQEKCVFEFLFLTVNQQANKLKCR